jgi:L,D-transpeptidase ErfK/SrfK
MRTAILILMLAAGVGAVPLMTGGVFSHVAGPEDTLQSIGSRFGVDSAVLASDNQLRPGARLPAGATLVVDNRHLIPAGAEPPAIVINVAQRLLFFFQEDGTVRAFPVAVGRPDWPTPRGRFEIAVKEVDPDWDVPISIQEEMAHKGQPVLTKVPPGPDNPLGNRWLGLSIPAVGIHGTNHPSSIYGFTTHGCIRVHPDDILVLFDLVSVGTRVELIYEPVLLASDERGGIYLEVHRDVYRVASSPGRRVERLLREAGLEHLAGSAAVREAIAAHSGRAVIVGERGSRSRW